MSKKGWGQKLIEGLVKEKQAQIDAEEQEQKKKKKDGAWQDDPVEYEKRLKSGKKHFEEDPIIQSYMKKK